MHKLERYTFIDALRGFAIINMILYHALWDVNYIFGVKIVWYTSNIGYVWQQMICCTFIFVSGLCFPLGKHKLKRGLITLGCSAIISIVTVLFMPQNIVLFGILSLIGSSIVITIPCERLLQKINCYLGFVAFVAAFVLAKNFASYPQWLYSNLFTAYLGFPPQGFVSMDYFPLIPWLFLFISGYFACSIFKKHNLMPLMNKIKCRPLQWAGRHSLVIYMVHQPVIYVLLSIVYKLI